mgnify:FL=1
MSISDMREPFDAMIPQGRQIDEALGRELAAWSRGAPRPATVVPSVTPPADGATYLGAAEAAAARGLPALQEFWKGLTNEQRAALLPERERLKADAAKVGTEGAL